MKKRMISLLLAIVMVLGLLPTVALAENAPKVRVIVENTTFTSEDAAWSGRLVDAWVDLDSSSTMMSCVVDALGSHSVSGADSGYITEIDGLSEGDGGMMSGWMGSLNDWFTNEGFDAFTAASGKLAAGDEIRIMYSCNYGEDLDSSWSNNDKTLSAVSFSTGTLNQAFSKEIHAYGLTVPADVSALTVTPTASNKNYQVRTFVGAAEYKRSASVPVENGTVITVKCGDPGWPSMNSGSEPAQIYTFTVKKPISVTGVSLNKTSLALEIGSSEQLTASVQPENAENKSVAWASSDASVASVAEDGTVTALAEGSAQITVTTADGAKTASCTVSITAPPTETVTLTVKAAPKAVDVSFFYADGTQQLPSARVTDNGVVGNYHQYTLKVPAGEYAYRGMEAGTALGGGPLKVGTANSSVTLVRTNLYVNSTAFDQIGDYSITKMQNPTKQEMTAGEPYISSGKVYTPYFLSSVSGNTSYSWDYSLAESKLEDYYKGSVPAISVSATATAAKSQKISATDYKKISLTAPSDANTVFYAQEKNFLMKKVVPNPSAAGSMDSVTVNEDGTTTYVFKGTAAHSNYEYRVSKEGMVTQAGYLKDGDKLTVTFPEGRTPADTTSTLAYDDNSVLLNINTQNELNMAVGETFKLRAYRAAWEIINTTTGNIMVEPDFHYAILSGSDVISVDATDSSSKGAPYCSGNASGNWMNVTALKQGTAIVAVCYDALDVYGANPSNATGITTFGAADPARCGVFVVRVGDDSRVTWNPVSQDGDWDAEFDTVYYTGDSGTFTFKPAQSASSVTVQNVCGTALGGVQSIAVSADGTYTVPVTTGANVIAVTTEAGTDYQIVRAKEISYTIKNKTTGESAVNGAPAIKTGDSVTISLGKLDMPIPKMSGIYNPGYLGTGKTAYMMNGEYLLTSKGTQYDFSSNHDITFTALVEGQNSLQGYISLSSMGSDFGAHRNITDAGAPANMNASEKFGSFGILPDITFTVDENSEYDSSTEDLTKLSSLQLYVGASTYMVGIEKAITDTKGNVISTWKNPSATMGLHVKAEAASYLSKLQMRYWYEGEQPKTVDLTSGVESVLSGSDFTPDGTKLLNLQILVTPPAGMGEAKAYNYVILGGTANQKYVHPVIKTLSVSSEGKTLALSPAVDCLCTEYELDAYNVTSINLAGTQAIKIYNTSTAADMSDSVVLTKMKSGSQVGEPVTILEAGLPNNPNRDWRCENVDITDADTLKLTVTSYVDSSISREYSIKLHVWEKGEITKPATCTEDGVKVLNCKNCEQTRTETIPATGHSYSAASYAWNENNQCTQTKTCTACTAETEGHTEVKTVDGVYCKDTDATCTSPEKGHYEAVFGETKLSTAPNSAVKGDPTGHSFTDWKADGSGYTASCVCGESISSVRASVDFTAQTEGAFLFAPQQKVEVDSSLAERYGYQDAVPADQNVSVLDVLVKAHEIAFEDAFTEEICEAYLTLNYGSPAMQFGIEDYYGGFFLNHGFANDGTKFDATNYNGTLVSTQKVQSGDLVEFFFYEDEFWGDTYNWFADENGYARSFNAAAGEELELTLKGVMAMSASCFKDAEEMVSSDRAEAIEDAQIYLVDAETGAMEPISGAVTDEDGAVSLKFTEPGTYILAAYGTEDCTFTQILSLTSVTVSFAERDYKTVLDKTLEQLAVNVPEPSMGSVKGEWTVLALARGGEFETGSVYFENYYERLATAVKSAADASGKLDANKSTENSRVILALSAIGKDAADVGGVDLIAPYDDFVWIKAQGVNGPIFALIALDSAEYETADTAVRQRCVDYILENQLENGSWSLDGQTPDADLTSMALQALAAYQNDEKVTAAAEKAFDYLSKVQSSGDFGSAESDAQYLIACAAWGVDDEAAVQALLSYYLEDSHAFSHQRGGAANAMATDQAAYALVAYDRMKNGQNRLYDMTDVEKEQKSQAYEEILEKLTETAEAVADARYQTYLKVQNAKSDFAKYKASDDYQSKTAEQKQALQDAADELQAAYDEKLNEAKEEQKKLLRERYLAVDQSKLSAASLKELNKVYAEALAELEDGLYKEQLVSIVELAAEQMENIEKKIRVTFRLIGCEQADQSVNLSVSSYLPEYITWIPTTGYVMKKDSTVYDLLLKALEDNGLSQRGANANYVESITAPSVLGGFWLSEFDNGPKSGWMFTVNGAHPTVGLKDQKLKDGDTVIWHYVNDYANEVSDWISSSTGSSATYNGWLRAKDISPDQFVKDRLDKTVTVYGKGTVLPELKYSDLGRNITFTFVPDPGQTVKEVVVNGQSKGAVTSYTVSNLSYADRIEVWFTGSKLRFIDVHEGDWFYSDVAYAVEKGLFSGVSEKLFAPNSPMTRAMLVTVLYRLEGSPRVIGTDGFADTAKNTWYSDALCWAVRAGVIKGISDTTFAPDMNVTREQMAAILYRYASYKGYNTGAAASLNVYADGAKVSDYAREAMSWANANGIITGIGSWLHPAESATRAQVAALLHRFCEKIVK